MAPRHAGWYEALLEATPGVVLVVDREGTVRYADPSVEAALGYEPDAVVGRSASEFVHPEDREAFVGRFAGPDDGDRLDAAPVTVRVRTADGLWLIAEAVVRDRPAEDRIDGYVVSLRDVADAAEASTYRTLVESVADPMYWLDPEGTIEMVNDAMVEFMGADRDRLVGRDVATLLDDDDVAAVESMIREQRSLETDERVRHEFEMDSPGRDARWVEANLSTVVENGEFRGTVGVVRDVTERKRREQELAEFETIVETAPVGLFTLDEGAVITWANEVWAETLEISREELVGTEFMDLVEAGYYDEFVVEPYLETVRDLLSSEGDASQGSYLVETYPPGGGTLLHEVHTALLPTEDGEFAGTVSAFRDVTTQKEYERRLERQNERLDAFTSVVSHDLRNPLAIAEGNLDIAMESGDLDRLESVERAHDRMDSLIDDLLSLARDGRTVENVEAVSLAAVARRAWETADTGGASLRVDGPGSVLADSARLQQLFENLFRNATEHGTSGEADDAPIADLTVTVGPLADEGFYVADDGVGISPDEREKVFDRGYTTAEGGTGFGLAIVETIADAHGWSVRVTDGERGGVRFEVQGVERPS